jgi:hypothetical protein
MRHHRLVTASSLLLIWSTAATHADLSFEFNRCYGFFVYGYDSNPYVQSVFAADARWMSEALAVVGGGFWQNRVYGPHNGGLPAALRDMEGYADSVDLEFLFYSGHGGGYHGAGEPDFDADESQAEDPLPAYPDHDGWDETVWWGPGPDDYMVDDELGRRLRDLQSECWVAGALDSCHSGGLLDGSDDIRGHYGRASVWFTSSTEWQLSPVGGPYGTLAASLRATFDLDCAMDTLGHLWSWYWDAADYAVANGLIYPDQTLKLKLYEEDGSGTNSYVPTPAAATLLGLGCISLGRRRTARAR